ncbi:MAG: hypothetical protein B6D78_01680 [gamma proteobacterium symbiont of Ctena orbiculata]|nr:MAG: hypothetical protein B6D79_16830 [gamma proteobacterium symbiont of Ctena orbiculata]PVV24329.1 MAG: hypothetical protein B6D78_01680 [gamma proteobacterium symbiont of Ctena orbiculata]
MELLNATPMPAGYTMSMLPDGHELLVIVVKGTFKIPERGGQPDYIEPQKQLVEADVYTGEPGFSAPLYELDYAPFKRHCDVLLAGSAYAPRDKPTSRVEVTLRLGPLFKSFAVCGDRFWESGNIAIRPGYSGIFDRMPISYDRAFGGVDNYHDNENKHSAFMKNPVGKGYHQQLGRSFVNGSPMPNTEELQRPVSMPNGNYAPMSFGPLGRCWQPRLQLAGTIDQDWVENIYPLPPADFDAGYFQAAPADQQIPYPQGGERVFLGNLTPEGSTSFTLPELDVPVVFFYKKGESVKKKAVMDTIVLEPDQGLFTITWRAFTPLKENILEIPQVLVGRKSRGWWRAREFGKTYYPSLDHMMRDRKKRIDPDE